MRKTLTNPLRGPSTFIEYQFNEISAEKISKIRTFKMIGTVTVEAPGNIPRWPQKEMAGLPIDHHICHCSSK